MEVGVGGNMGLRLEGTESEDSDLVLAMRTGEVRKLSSRWVSKGSQPD